MLAASRAASAHSSAARRRRASRDVARAFGLGLGPRRGECCAEPGDAAMAAPAAEHRQLEDAGGLPAVARVHAEGGEGMLEEREEPRRLGRLGERLGEEPGEDALRQEVEPGAGGIVDLEAPAPEFGRDAPRERPVRGDQRDRRAGRLERLADGDGDRERLLLLVVGEEVGDAGERRVEGARRDQAGTDRRPGVGGLGRAERLGGKPRRGRRAAPGPRRGR